MTGWLSALLAGAIAVLGVVWRVFAAGRESGRDEQRSKELDAYEKHLNDIMDAGNARPTGSVLDDPHNRDNVRH